MEDPAVLRCLDAYRRAHPGEMIGAIGRGLWQAVIPEGSGERVITRPGLAELLGVLGSLPRRPAALRAVAARHCPPPRPRRRL